MGYHQPQCIGPDGDFATPIDALPPPLSLDGSSTKPPRESSYVAQGPAKEEDRPRFCDLAVQAVESRPKRTMDRGNGYSAGRGVAPGTLPTLAVPFVIAQPTAGLHRSGVFRWLPL